MLQKLLERLGPNLRLVSISLSSHHNEVRVVLAFAFTVLNVRGASCGWMYESGTASTIEEAIDIAEAKLWKAKQLNDAMLPSTTIDRATYIPVKKASIDELEL